MNKEKAIEYLEQTIRSQVLWMVYGVLQEAAEHEVLGRVDDREIAAAIMRALLSPIVTDESIAINSASAKKRVADSKANQ